MRSHVYWKRVSSFALSQYHDVYSRRINSTVFLRICGTEMNPPQVILLTVCARIIHIKVIHFLMYIARISTDKQVFKCALRRRKGKNSNNLMMRIKPHAAERN